MTAGCCFRCFAGCEFVDILDELKHRGLVDDGRTGSDEPVHAIAFHRLSRPKP